MRICNRVRVHSWLLVSYGLENRKGVGVSPRTWRGLVERKRGRERDLERQIER